MCKKNQCGKPKLLVCFLFVLFFNVSAVYGQSASHYFEIGVRAAQQQQYHVALQAFLQAKSAGLVSAALDYNLGVVYYKLAEYDKAANRFRQLKDNSEYAAVAFYNLGLIELKLDNDKTAINWFLKSYKNSSDPKLKNLSARALQRLGVAPPSEKSTLSSWNGFVSLSGGYDDNVSLIDEDVSQDTGIADYHLEALATADRMMWGTEDNGIHFSANIDVLKQQKEHEYDYSQWHMGVAHWGVFNRWRTRGKASIDQTRFGNADFQQLLGLELRSQRRFSAKTGVELRYKYVGIKDQSPDGVYDYLAGNRQQLRVRLTNKRKNIRFKYAYELQLNDRNDLNISFFNSANNTTTFVFRSYSPLRHNVQVSADIPLGKAFTVNMEAQYRYSYYGDADTVRVFDHTTGATTVPYSLNREDRRYKFGLGLAYSFTRSLQIFSDYSYTKNDSNRNGSDYSRHLIRAGVTWFY